MSRKSRKDRASAFSLFSFQDAITSAVGVIVLVTLMLAVRMTQSAAEKSELERRLERAKLPDSTDEFLDEAIKLDPTEIAARLRAAKRKLTAAEREKARLEEERAELDESATEREKLQKGNSKLEEEIEEEREKKEEAL